MNIKFLFGISLCFYFSLLTLSCKKLHSSKIKNGNLDLSGYELIQFKSAQGLGVSGTRYDLSLGSKTLKKYTFDSKQGYVLNSELTMTQATRSSLKGRLAKLNMNTWQQCSDCTKERATVWVEITDRTPQEFYFSREGDCTCPSDAADTPTLPYGTMKAIYDEILSLTKT